LLDDPQGAILCNSASWHDYKPVIETFKRLFTLIRGIIGVMADQNLDNYRPEDLWDGLLSRQPRLICTFFDSLAPAEQKTVMAHLQRMVAEDGWHPEQRISAQAALDALQQQGDQR
jgi:hypothetical protein